MDNMISIASGFQYSVNIGYDLNSDDKIKNFIPTQSAFSLLEEILLSTNTASTERARVLIGAYGKGKSHIVLMILSMLMKKDLSLFKKVLPKLAEYPRLEQCIKNYYAENEKIFPVVITGSNTSLPQAFLLALQRSLAENDLLDIMPETNYKAAAAVIERWKNEFPETYIQLQNKISKPIKAFQSDLEDYNVEAYEEFERVYPALTAGSVFNPFLGFDVVELYENAVKGLRTKGYSGIYVIYDEFSKFLEANISEASMSDTKMLQDFAEKCNRSGKEQMHLMLISHKEISNYIDKLPKQKVDGWRGVSERFKHIHLSNNFGQTYEIIASVITKEETLWKEFCKKYQDRFTGMKAKYAAHAVFEDLSDSEIDIMLYGAYPMHPISTFILPRLSEMVAQNERTLFTFLSANGNATLPAFLSSYDVSQFTMITPDVIFDYFEPLFKKELYDGSLHKNYVLAMNVLKNLSEGTLESKIVKTLSLIDILEQYEKLKPTKEEMVGIFSVQYTVDEIEAALKDLIDKEYVVYLKRSNNYLKLKQTSGVDVKQLIRSTIEQQTRTVSVKSILNSANFDNYMYPSRYNDEKEIIRYFSFEFIDEDEVTDEVDWSIKSESSDSDGVIYGVILKNGESIEELRLKLLQTSAGCQNCIFVILKHYSEIEMIVREFNAVSILREKASDDRVLLDEYEVMYEDLREVIAEYINSYTHPEKFSAFYIYRGNEVKARRKADLSALMSDICDEMFSRTPIICNEALNKAVPTTMAVNSRGKIIAGLLRKELEFNLGLLGSGQEVAIMRSTLIRTGILVNQKECTRLNLQPDDENMTNMLQIIIDFFQDSKQNSNLTFADLYYRLISSEYHIGLRRGLIPLYIAVVLHEYRQQVVIKDRLGQITIDADLLLQINANPEAFSIAYLDWNQDKEEFVVSLEEIFRGYIIDAEKGSNTYDYVVSAMKRWYMNLPKYTKQLKNREVDRRYFAMMKLFKKGVSGKELLFEQLPEAFEMQNNEYATLATYIKQAKSYFDNGLKRLRRDLIKTVKVNYTGQTDDVLLEKMSVGSVIKDWCETLNPAVFEQLFNDGTDRCLRLFKTITNDEDLFVEQFARMATGLRIEDWDSSVMRKFNAVSIQYKKTAEEFVVEEERNETANIETNVNQITFAEKDGSAVVKRFERVEVSKRGQLLHNQLTMALDSMGQSISEQEKRQILMDVLKKLC